MLNRLLIRVGKEGARGALVSVLFVEHLLCARHCAEFFMCIFFLNHNNPGMGASIPIFRMWKLRLSEVNGLCCQWDGSGNNRHALLPPSAGFCHYYLTQTPPSSGSHPTQAPLTLFTSVLPPGSWDPVGSCAHGV